MWQLLTEHGDTEIVVSHMLAEYEIDEARLREDLAGIIAHLVEAGLVTEQT